MKSVVFIGHDDCYGLDRDVLHQIIIKCIEKGATSFLSGGQGGFDRACAVAVYKAKNEYPHIRNILVIPYRHFNVFNDKYFDEIVFQQKFILTDFQPKKEAVNTIFDCFYNRSCKLLDIQMRLCIRQEENALSTRWASIKSTRRRRKSLRIGKERRKNRMIIMRM